MYYNVDPEVLFRLDKTDLRPETQTERPGPISDPTPEICSPESGPKTQIDPSRTMPDPKFSTKLLIFDMTSVFDQKLVHSKLT